MSANRITEYAHMQNDLNLNITCMFKGDFSTDVVQLILLKGLDNNSL